MSLDTVKKLGPGIPGIVARSDGTFELHRSHAPLVQQLGVVIPRTPLGPEFDNVRGVTFRPWQKRAYAWAMPRRGVLIVAEPRMGKSATALALHDPSKGPLVILAPLDVRQVWLEWVARMFPDAKVVTMKGRTVDLTARREADVVFGHYDIAADQSVVGRRIGTLIVDEAHLLSNAASRRSNGVRSFAASAERVVVLTGTPLWNSTKGLWPLLATANPGAWGTSPFVFQQRYCAPSLTEYGWRYGEISNQEEWALRRSEVVFEADWATERPDLTPTIRRFVDVPLDADALSWLDEFVEEMRRGDGGDLLIAAIGRYRQATARFKTAAVVDTVLADPGPVVVWTWHRSVAAVIKRELLKRDRPTLMISGGEAIDKRQATIDQWRASRGGVLCATLAVGQVGIDLSHAKRAIFAELDWTPAVLYQAEMRTFTPDRPMEVIYVRIDHAVERMLVNTLLAKLERATASSMPAAGSGFAPEASDTADEATLLADLARLFTDGGG